jgi:hypothetical protein
VVGGNIEVTRSHRRSRRRLRCRYTGLTIPECSCRACLLAQVTRNAPDVVGAGRIRVGSAG